MNKKQGTSKIRVIAIFGPTAVGKSRVAVEVSRAAGGEIVSADSMQVYSGLSILTDQPPAEMLAEAPHHLVASLALSEEYSAARFAHEAAIVIRDIYGRGNLPLLVGGTGLYIRALLGGFGFAGRPGASTRKKWSDLIDKQGTETAILELERLDPASANKIDSKNPRRLVRALEAAEAAAEKSGKTISAERHRLWSSDSPYEVASFGLMRPREEIYRLIDERVESMLAAGAIEEVRAARQGHVSDTATQAIGFREIGDYLDGKITLEDTAAVIKQKSRRYAKRQLTWMRKMPDIVRIDLAGSDAGVTVRAAAAIIDLIK